MSDEALRLLRNARKWMTIGVAPTAWQNSILKWREDAAVIKTLINKCNCGAQVCARCGSCRRENRIFPSDCRAWGTIYIRHIWKWEPED